jgi:hypothetical protein
MSQQEMTAVITSVMWSLSHTFIPQTIPKTNQTWKSKFLQQLWFVAKDNHQLCNCSEESFKIGTNPKM